MRLKHAWVKVETLRICQSAGVYDVDRHTAVATERLTSMSLNYPCAVGETFVTDQCRAAGAIKNAVVHWLF